MMATPLRVVVFVGLMSGLTFVFTQSDWDGVSEINDLSRGFRNVLNLHRENKRGGDIDMKSREIVQRIATKDRIAEDVRQGKISLREGAYQFRTVAGGAWYTWDIYEQTNLSWSEERRCCQYVIELVEQHMRDKGEDPTTVVRELTRQAEVQQ